MNNVIEIVAVVSLTILGISLLVLVISLIPLLNQAQKTLGALNDLTRNVNTQIMPNLAEFSGILSKARQVVDKGENLTSKLGKSADAFKEGVRAGISSYFNKNKSANEQIPNKELNSI